MFLYKKSILFLLVVATLMLCLSSCSESQRKGFEIKNNALGKAGAVLVVAEDNLWNGMLGDSVRNFLEKPFGVLPQNEPSFDIKHVAGEKFKGFNKEFRAIVMLAVLSDGQNASRQLIELLGPERVEKAKTDTSFNSIMLEDLWAKGQKIFFFFGQTEAQVADAFSKRQQTVINTVSAMDVIQLNANNYQGGKNELLNKKISEDLGVNITLPSNFELAVYDSLNQAMWVRKETGSTSNNVLIQTIPYKEQSQLTRENLIAIRDSLGKNYITSAAEDAYMMTDKKNLEIRYNELQVNNNFAIHAQGIWKLHNDFMGGPFTSYLVHHQDGGKLVFIDGFVHAPGKPKRPLLQQMDLIINSINF